MRALLKARLQTAAEDASAPPKRRRIAKKGAHQQALTIVESMWGNVDGGGVESSKCDKGPRHMTSARMHTAARAQMDTVGSEVLPYSSKRIPKADLHPRGSGLRLQ